MITLKHLCTGLTSGFLLFAASSVYAIPVTYNFSVSGIVDVLGTKTVVTKNSSGTVTNSTKTTTSNLFGFTTLPATITASGTFKADLGPTNSGTVYFDAAAFAANGNIMTITGGSTTLLASYDSGYSSGVGAYLTFSNGSLTNFDYQKLTTSKFNSLGTYFDDMTSVATVITNNGKNGSQKITYETTYNALFGHWDTGTAVVSAVPEASTYTMMLAGLGLVGLMGVVRRKSLALPA